MADERLQGDDDQPEREIQADAPGGAGRPSPSRPSSAPLDGERDEPIAMASQTARPSSTSPMPPSAGAAVGATAAGGIAVAPGDRDELGSVEPPTATDRLPSPCA